MTDRGHQLIGEGFLARRARWSGWRPVVACALMTAGGIAVLPFVGEPGASALRLFFPTATTLVFLLSYHMCSPRHYGIERFARVVLATPMLTATVVTTVLLLMLLAAHPYDPFLFILVPAVWIWCFLLGIPVCLLYFFLVRPIRIIRQGIYCPNCDYRIDNIKGPHCPECGLRVMA